MIAAEKIAYGGGFTAWGGTVMVCGVMADASPEMTTIYVLPGVLLSVLGLLLIRSGVKS